MWLSAIVNPEMMVYKYLHPERIDVLRDTRIRFTQPAALNDPFEMMPNLLEIRRYYAALSEEVNRDMDPTGSAVQSILTQWKITDTFGRWQADNPSELAFLSLSKNRNNPLMWSHYCDSHHGFVIGFDATNSFFRLAKPGVSQYCRKLDIRLTGRLYPRSMVTGSNSCGQRPTS